MRLFRRDNDEIDPSDSKGWNAKGFAPMDEDNITEEEYEISMELM